MSCSRANKASREDTYPSVPRATADKVSQMVGLPYSLGLHSALNGQRRAQVTQEMGCGWGRWAVDVPSP